MTHSVDATDAGCRSGAIRFLRWAFLIVALFGIVAPSAVLVWQAITPNVVLRRAAAGTFISARTRTAFLSRAWTTVDTTRGSLNVTGLFSAPRGQPLEVVRRSQTPGIELCAMGHLDSCLPLAGTWAGALRPTLAHGHAVDFPHYGLTADHLALWLFLGCVLMCVCGVGWLLVHLELIDATPDSVEPPNLTGPNP